MTADDGREGGHRVLGLSLAGDELEVPVFEPGTPVALQFPCASGPL